MTASILEAVAPLMEEMSPSLRTDRALCADLPDLLLAGLAIEQGVGMRRIASFLPRMDVRRFQAGLSKVMAHPELSVWYFNSLDRLQRDFRARGDGDGARFENRLPKAAGHAGVSLRKLVPPMPVANSDSMFIRSE